MSPSRFKPVTIDTSNISLPTELTNLVEMLARNTHDVWARQRLLEGWTYGRHRNDKNKEDPLLIPFDQLATNEQEYARNAVTEILKVIHKEGFTLVKEKSLTAAHELKTSAASMDFLQQFGSLNLGSLLSLWHSRIPSEWIDTPEIYQYLGQRILKFGEPLLAYDVVTEGLTCSPKNVRLQQLLALSLARSGATQRANELLMKLRKEGHLDEETLGILARTHKDFWSQASDPKEQKRHLRLAHKYYMEAYKLHRGYYAGINAATLSLQLGKNDQAVQLADEVTSICLKVLAETPEKDPNRYWPLATLGEAALIKRRWSEAENWYGQAGELGRGNFVELSSTRRNARLILDHLGRDRASVEAAFRIPRVAVFSGHMIDQGDRATPRFPPHLESEVAATIRARLNQLDIGIGFASAACGSDILFLEALLERDGDAHIVLPFNKERFIEESVDVGKGNWRERFDRVMLQASQVITASNHQLNDDSTSYEYANLLLHGLAKIKARQLETGLVRQVVWDGRGGDGPGGTASVIEEWQSAGHEVDVIDLGEILRRSPSAVEIRSRKKKVTRKSRSKPGTLPTQIRAMLFADAINFSKLDEQQIPLFLKHFLRPIGKLSSKAAYDPEVKNTWGDGLFFVFENVRDVGLFALELAELISETSWESKGLSKDLNLRIALHAGPVYSVTDPITDQPTISGTHVSRAARIEPITPPGQVYASQAFAALAAAQGIEEFSCDYVGQTPLAKGYGTFPTYHVQRRRRKKQ